MEQFDLKDSTIGTRLFCLFKGEPGTGKTIAAASFPEPTIVDLDNRAAAAKKMFPNKSIRVYRFANYPELWDFLMEYRDPGTLIVDGLTRLADKTMSFAVQLDGRPTNRWGSDHKGSDGLRSSFPIPYEIQDWGGEDRGLTAILDRLQTLPCHVILTAHVVTVEQTELKKGAGRVTHTSRSLLTGGKKVAAKIGIWFDEVYHFNVETPLGEATRYTVLTEHTGDDWAKTALPLPRKIDFTMQPGDSGLYDKIMQYVIAEREVTHL